MIMMKTKVATANELWTDAKNKLREKRRCLEAAPNFFLGCA
jgi:hypothetical protein